MGKKSSSGSSGGQGGPSSPPSSSKSAPAPPPIPPPGTPPPPVPSPGNRRRIPSPKPTFRTPTRKTSTGSAGSSSADESASSSAVLTPVHTPENSETTEDPTALLVVSQWGQGGGFPAHLQPQQQQQSSSSQPPLQSAMSTGGSASNNKPPSRMPHRRSFTWSKSPTAAEGKKKKSIGSSIGGKIKRSISLGSTGSQKSNDHHKSEPFLDQASSTGGAGSGPWSLFHVTFSEDPPGIRDVEKATPDEKPRVWYVAKELRQLLATEIDHARRLDEGDFDMFDAVDQDDDDEIQWVTKAMSGRLTAAELEEMASWRGLEHILEEDDRSARIRKTIVGIVSWYHDAKEMGYNDPEELRVVSKSRTKSDRTKAQKRGTQDATYVKKMLKGELMEGDSERPSASSSSGRGRSLSPKKMVQKVSKKINMPRMHWSPKPNKKEKIIPVEC